MRLRPRACSTRGSRRADHPIPNTRLSGRAGHRHPADRSPKDAAGGRRRCRAIGVSGIHPPSRAAPASLRLAGPAQAVAERRPQGLLCAGVQAVRPLRPYRPPASRVPLPQSPLSCGCHRPCRDRRADPCTRSTGAPLVLTATPPLCTKRPCSARPRPLCASHRGWRGEEDYRRLPRPRRRPRNAHPPEASCKGRREGATLPGAGR